VIARRIAKKTIVNVTKPIDKCHTHAEGGGFGIEMEWVRRETVKMTKANGVGKEWWRDPLDSGKFTRALGHVWVNREHCKGCKFCIQFCPMDVLVESEAMNAKGYHYPEVGKPGECTGCRLCEHICPEFAIVVSKEGEVPICAKY
jgi:2-oxoglutarate ferredoxin oxidoreductase subunit delta